MAAPGAGTAGAAAGAGRAPGGAPGAGGGGRAGGAAREHRRLHRAPRRGRRPGDVGALQPRRRAPRVAARPDRGEPAGSRHRSRQPRPADPGGGPAPRPRGDDGARLLALKTHASRTAAGLHRLEIPAPWRPRDDGADADALLADRFDLPEGTRATDVQTRALAAARTMEQLLDEVMEQWESGRSRTRAGRVHHAVHESVRAAGRTAGSLAGVAGRLVSQAVGTVSDKLARG